MTIKRRLFISNILMFLIPILLTVVIGVISVLIFRNAHYAKIEEHYWDSERIYSAIEEFQELNEADSEGSSVENLTEKINAITRQERFRILNFLIYENKELKYSYGNLNVDLPLDLMLNQTGEHYYTLDNLAVYVTDIEQYKFIIFDEQFIMENLEDYQQVNQKTERQLWVVVVIAGIIIFITNRLLVKFVIDSIIIPLDLLTYGVHEIRDGNLKYRLKYDKQDEFKQVCEDFNEMAEHLQQMVEERQKDQDSRKQLIAGISHDLRTPLTSIKGYIIGLEEGIDKTPQIRSRYINVIKEKTNVLEAMVNQLFWYSKVDIGEFPIYMKTVDLGYQLEQFVSSMQEEYQQKGLVIHLIKETEKITANCDFSLLETVITNICENALKYIDRKDKVLKIDYCVDGNGVLIKLTDNGNGVPQESLPQLFDVFYRTDSSRNDTTKGSGLGLAISRKIVERMGGQVSAVTGEDGGLSIHISLPRSERTC